MTDRFTDNSIDRRTFIRLSAATAGTLTLPGNATSEVSSAKLSEEYQFIVNHTPIDHSIPTLIRFSNGSEFSVINSLIDGEVMTTTEPEPAAYAMLTSSDVEQVIELPTAETLSHSPGSNPFWRLGYYPLGVFPEPKRSVDYIDYEQMIDGMQHLQSQYPDRLDFYSIGKSPGFENAISGRRDPKNVYVAEVTNNINDQESYEEKAKILYCLGIHGAERQGVEAGTRFVENILEGRERSTEALLDDAVLIFLYANPDGWVAPHPQYPSQPIHKRGNAKVGDTNRQFPITGWIDPSHYPAEPDGQNLSDDKPGLDSDIPSDITAHVPDALAIVDHFRDYKNLSYGADFHGAAHSKNFVFGLISQAQFDHVDLHELYEMNHAIDDALEGALNEWNTIADIQETITGDRNVEVIGFDTLPEQAYDFAAIWDTVGYTDSGFFGDWLAHPEEHGGLGMTTMDLEMTYSAGLSTVYIPALVDLHVQGFTAVVRGLAEYAVQNSDTPNTENRFSATIETDGNSLGYVTTDSLTRTSADLSFKQGTDSATATSSTSEQVSLSPGLSRRVEFTVPEDTDSVSIQVRPLLEEISEIRIIGPSEDLIAKFEPNGSIRKANGWTFRYPESGRLAAQIVSEGTAQRDIEIELTTLQTTAENPDPNEAVGYSQRDYKVSPFTYFDRDYIPDTDALRQFSPDIDYGDVTDSPVGELTLDDIKNDVHLSHDNLVIIHDEGRDDSEYLAALDRYVDRGGNLVLTDRGIHLLGHLENDLASDIGEADIRTSGFYVGHIAQRNGDHPLLEGTRPIQQQLWKPVCLGYLAGSAPNLLVQGPADASQAPITLVSTQAFEEAEGSIAGQTDGDVVAGTLRGADDSETIRDVVDGSGGSIHIIGSLFPPSDQSNLHPFGLLDYSVSFLGHTILTNALGYVQKRSVEGKTLAEIGGEATY